MNLIFGILFLLAAERLAVFVLRKETRKLRALNQAMRTFSEKDAALDRWLLARPFIYYGYCAYARSLIISMIETYEHMLELGYKSDLDYIEILMNLLDEFPPDSDPPFQTEGLLFFK